MSERPGSGFAKEQFGLTWSEAIEHGVCITCGTDALDLQTELERREYGLSAMCHECQIAVFKTPKRRERKP